MTARAGLEGKLKSYELSTVGYLGMRQPASGESKHPSWTAYAAVAGSALAMAGQADAIILYSGANQNVTVERTTSGTSFNSFKPISVTYGGTFAFPIANLVLFADATSAAGGVVANAFYGTGTTPPPAFMFPIISTATLGFAGALKKFASGDSIGTSPGTNSGLALIGFGAGSYFGYAGQWTPGEIGFAGIATYTGTGPGIGLRGWIRLSFESDPALTTDGLINRVTAIDWAIADEPLRAGQTTRADIPEPATLGLLALGAAGMGAMRRRRKAAETSVH